MERVYQESPTIFPQILLGREVREDVLKILLTLLPFQLETGQPTSHVSDSKLLALLEQKVNLSRRCASEVVSLFGLKLWPMSIESRQNHSSHIHTIENRLSLYHCHSQLEPLLHLLPFSSSSTKSLIVNDVFHLFKYERRRCIGNQ